MKEASEDKAIIKLAKQVSHDIRSPLISLRTLLLDQVDADKNILNSVERINSIANDLLNKSRSNASEMLPILKIVEAFNELGFENKDKLNSKKLTFLIVNNISGNVFVEANLSQLKRVFSNLLNNAINASFFSKIKVHIENKNGFINIIINLSYEVIHCA